MEWHRPLHVFVSQGKVSLPAARLLLLGMCDVKHLSQVCLSGGPSLR